MSPAEELRKARDAEQVVNAPIFQEARKHLESQLAQLRRDVPIHQTEMHTRLILMEQLSVRFFGYFDQLVQTGKFAQVKLSEEERRRNIFQEGMAAVRRIGRNAL